MSVIHIDSGDIFAAEGEAIVNPVNCVGAMGKGLALEFKNRFPENNQAYREACEMRSLYPGGLYAFDQRSIVGKKLLTSDARWIVNLATKDHWKDPSRIEWVTEGAQTLARWAKDFGVKSIACPALGAGLGGLDWEDVQREIVTAFLEVDVKLMLFAPQGPAPKPQRNVFSTKQML